MLKIGIIGTENLHARQFTGIFSGNGEYADFKVTHAGGMYPEANEKLKNEFDFVKIVENPLDMLGEVDAVMVTCRDGKYHAQFAKPFIEAGIPAFIDKPFTRDSEEAVSLARLAKEKGVPIMGGSALKSAYDVLMLANEVAKNPSEVKVGALLAPLSMENEYGGFYFYSSHLAEMTLRIFGYNPLEVTAQECNNHVSVLTRYENYIVTNRFIDGCYKYWGQIVNKNGIYQRDIDISLIFKHECAEFAEMLKTGKMKYSYEQLVAPVHYLNAVHKSYITGKTVKVEPVEI